MSTIEDGHLVVTREVGQRIFVTVPPCVDETLVMIDLDSIRGMTRARIRVTAPQYAEIDREEVYDAKRREQSEARKQ